MTVPTSERLAFRAMGTDLEVIVVDAPAGTATAARRRIDELEGLWSRFRPDSEVSRLTASAGQWVPVSPETALLVDRARAAWELTGGAFDPTVLGDVLRAGYTTSWDGPGPRRGGRSDLFTGCGDIEVRPGEVRLPAGTGFDPGGIGKGLAADLVTLDALRGGAAGICVNVGGDLRVAGPSPEGGAWTVAVEVPDGPGDRGLGPTGWWPTGTTRTACPRPCVLESGAVASSTSRRRTWTVDGVARHHLIDPRTGQPADSARAFATVVAGSGWLAEALATAVMLAPAEHPFDVLGGTGAEGLAIDGDGRVAATAGLDAYLAPRASERASA